MKLEKGKTYIYNTLELGNVWINNILKVTCLEAHDITYEIKYGSQTRIVYKDRFHRDNDSNYVETIKSE